MLVGIDLAFPVRCSFSTRLRRKGKARARASQLLPAAAHQWRLKRDDGRAEAALTALWGLRELNKGTGDGNMGRSTDWSTVSTPNPRKLHQRSLVSPT
jgi:hypothetical protein